MACKPGYYGVHCKFRCPSGSYGNRCGGVCFPTCLANECNHIFGCFKTTETKTTLSDSFPTLSQLMNTSEDYSVVSTKMKNVFTSEQITKRAFQTPHRYVETPEVYIFSSEKNNEFVTNEPMKNSWFKETYLLVGIGVISLFLLIIVIQLCIKSKLSNSISGGRPTNCENIANSEHPSQEFLRTQRVSGASLGSFKAHQVCRPLDVEYADIDEGLEMEIQNVSLSSNEYERPISLSRNLSQEFGYDAVVLGQDLLFGEASVDQIKNTENHDTYLKPIFHS